MTALSLSRRLGLAAAAALALAAGAASARSVADAKAAGTVVIGIQGDNCPWGCVNSSGAQEGFDADIGRAFARHLGVEPTFMPLAVANRIPALTTRKADVLFATMGMTAERAKSIQYSIPYAANQLSVVAARDRAIAGPADLAGLRAGVPRSSAMDNALTPIAPATAEVLRFDDDAANIQALLSGQVDAVGANQFYIRRLEAAAPGTYETKFPLVALYNGAGSRLGEEDWNEALNTFLAEFTRTDEYRAIYTRWLGVDLPQFPASMDGIPFTATQ